MFRTTKWALTLAAALLFGGTAHAAAISLWSFDDNVSPTADTGTAAVNSLALQNGATFSAANGGYVLSLDGVDDYGVHGAPASLPAGAAARTVAAWIYPTYTDPAGTLVAWGNGDLAGQDFMLMTMKVGADVYLFTDGENAANNLKFPAGYPQFIPPANQWSHVAFTYDGNTHWRFYLNGDEKFSGDFAAPLDTAGALGVFVGRRSDGTSQPYFPGKLDQVAVYGSELSAAQVFALYDIQAPVVSNAASTRPVTKLLPQTLTADVSDALAQTFSGVSTVAGVEYSVEGGAWLPMAAVDGAFDEVAEAVTASAAAPVGGWGPGMQICLRATDAVGNVSTPTCIASRFDNDPPVVSALSAQSPSALGAPFAINATVSDVGHGDSWIAGASYTIDGGPAVAMTNLTALDSSVEAFRAYATVATGGAHTVCVTGTDAWGNASAESCTAVTIYDAYATISGNHKPGRGSPDLTFSGWVALAGTELLGSVHINYKVVGTSCTFTPDGDSTLTIVDGDYALLMHWTRTCSNGSTGTDSDLLLTDAGGTSFPPANGIRLDDNVNDAFDISTPGVPLRLTHGSVNVVDLAP